RFAGGLAIAPRRALADTGGGGGEGIRQLLRPHAEQSGPDAGYGRRGRSARLILHGRTLERLRRNGPLHLGLAISGLRRRRELVRSAEHAASTADAQLVGDLYRRGTGQPERRHHRATRPEGRRG